MHIVPNCRAASNLSMHFTHRQINKGMNMKGGFSKPVASSDLSRLSWGESCHNCSRFALIKNYRKLLHTPHLPFKPRYHIKTQQSTEICSKTCFKNSKTLWALLSISKWKQCVGPQWPTSKLTKTLHEISMVHRLAFKLQTISLECKKIIFGWTVKNWRSKIKCWLQSLTIMQPACV
jgi:hypothetical protein